MTDTPAPAHMNLLEAIHKVMDDQQVEVLRYSTSLMGERRITRLHIVPMERWRMSAKLPRLIFDFGRLGYAMSIVAEPLPHDYFDQTPVGVLRLERLP